MGMLPNVSFMSSNMAASKGIVFHDPSIESPTGFNEAWCKLTMQEKRDRLIGLLPGLVLHRIEKNKAGYEVRVVVGFAGIIKNKPKILRHTEANMREVLGADLEIICETRRDTSPLRRLTLKEVGHE